MIVRLGTAPRRDGLTPEQFQHHWRTSHADVVSTMPGLRRYQQMHAVLAEGEPMLPDPGFDACSLLRFDSVAGMDAAFASPQFLEAVQDDEAEFVDKSRFRGVMGTWSAPDLAELDDLGEVLVLTLWRADDGTTARELADRLRGAVDGPSGAIVADPDAHATRFPAMADVVTVAGYPDPAAAAAGAARTRGADVPAQVVGEHLARVVDVPVGAPTDQENGRTDA